MKPRLTKKVLRGLANLAAVAEAGGPADLFGTCNDNITMRAEQRTQYQEAMRACHWIRDMQKAREVCVEHMNWREG